MLTNKDYCDLDTSHELWVMGLEPEAYYDGPLILLYEAQKWLREEEGLFVNVELFGDYDRDADGKTLGTWIYYSYGILNTTTTDFIREYDLCTEYQTYEEALSEGIKEAVEILKENETIHE